MKICLYHTLNPEAIPGYKKFARPLRPITSFRLMFVKLTLIFTAHGSVSGTGYCFHCIAIRGKQSALYWNIFAIMPITLHVFFAKTWSLMRTAYNNNLCRILLIR